MGNNIQELLDRPVHEHDDFCYAAVYEPEVL